MPKRIRYEKTGRVAVITIDREKVYNALDTQTKNELIEAFSQANTDDEIGCVMITGSGDKAFCAGQDLNETVKYAPDDAEGWVRSFEDLYLAVRKLEKPLVAVVNGVATGSGFQLALICDVRICSAKASFAMTEIDVGFACIMGGSLMWDILGESITIEMCLSGRFMYADEAKTLGLAYQVYEPGELMEKSLEYCRELALKPPTAVRMNKKWFQLLGEERFQKCVDFAIYAHTEGYKAGEPNRYQEEFFESRKKP